VLAAIMAWVVLYWITEPIPLPITALLGTAFCVLAGLGSAKSVFASYAHPVIFLFIGSFLLAEAMAVHGLDRRFAAWMLSFAWVGVRPRRILLAIGMVTALISMWVSNTATTALMLPIALGVLATIRETPANELGEFRIGLMLMLSYGATAGGMATIVGTPPNLIGTALIAQQAGVPISFVTWMAVGLPLAMLMLLVAWAVLWWLHPAETSVLSGLTQHQQEQKLALGPWTIGQVNACVAFGTAVVLWVVPGLIAAMWGSDNPLTLWLDAHLPNELVAILAAGLLFLLPTNLGKGEWTLSWKQATGINWGIIILFGGGLAFGELMVKTGLSNSIGQEVVALFGSHTVWSLTAGSIVVAVLVSELVSNTATASMVIPVVIAIAQSAGISPVAPALGACLGASLGFALPVSTPPNAIVYGTGFVPIKSMLRTGLLYDLLGAILIWLTLRLMCPLVGLA
jgi:sodium-dependent dicarboxylate transporter 2/3/5